MREPSTQWKEHEPNVVARARFAMMRARSPASRVSTEARGASAEPTGLP
jgi:hypothetical protein